MMKNYYIYITLLFVFPVLSEAQLFQDDFGTAFVSISTANWPSGCRGGSASSFNTSIAPCASSTERGYSLSGFGSYITSSGIAIPASGTYELSFEYSFNYSFSFPSVEIRTGGTCGTTLLNTVTLSNTSGTCSPETVDLSAYAGQTIFIRFRSNTSSATFYLDEVLVDASAAGPGGGGSTCLLEDNFGTAFQSIDAANWPSGCRGGSPSGFNSSSAPCASTTERGYQMSGFGAYITSKALSIPATGFSLDFEYSFNYSFSFPSVEIRTGGTCGTSLLATHTLSNTGGSCTSESIDLSIYAGQTIFLRFRANTSSATFYLDEISVCGTAGPSGDFKWADNFNDNNLTPNYSGNDGDEACTGCGDWTAGAGASLELVPSGSWNGNSNETEAFPDNMSNVYYVKLDRNEYIESPSIDLSAQESFKISFYAKSSSSGTGGGDSWSNFSDHLRLQIWDGSAWITVKDITEGTSVEENQISPALPFNYFCFTAYKSNTSPGNYYYNSTPNVSSSYFHSDFKFRVIFEGGFSGAPYAWVDDFTFRADADGYSTMIPCGVSFWNQPMATGYGLDPDATAIDDSERGVNLELDNSISTPPLWASEADDGDQVDQVFGSGESERVVFAVISEQRIQFSFPRVHFYSPSIGWNSATMSIDNSYSGPGWRYYNVQYISCDLASSTISEPTDDFQYYYSFEYGNEFIPTFYHLNKSGIETGGGVTALSEVFNAPDVTSSDDCGALLPVELISFEGNYLSSNNAVLLEWKTSEEVDFIGFELERSSNGIDFETIAWQEAKGTSSTYELLDSEGPAIAAPTLYYRLKQLNQQGTIQHSKLIAVNVPVKEATIRCYPNPSQQFLYIDGIAWSPDLSLQVIDQLGKVHHCPFQQKNNQLTLHLIDLSPGVYYLKIKDGNGLYKMQAFVKK